MEMRYDDGTRAESEKIADAWLSKLNKDETLIAIGNFIEAASPFNCSKPNWEDTMYPTEWNFRTEAVRSSDSPSLDCRCSEQRKCEMKSL